MTAAEVLAIARLYGAAMWGIPPGNFQHNIDEDSIRLHSVPTYNRGLRIWPHYRRLKGADGLMAEIDEVAGMIGYKKQPGAVP